MIEVAGVVFILERDKAVVIGAIGAACDWISLLFEVVDIGAGDHELAHRIPALARPLNVSLCFGRIRPTGQDKKIIGVLAMSESGIGGAYTRDRAV
jgi:hypothetical protein